MVDPRFFKNSGPFRLRDLVDAAGAQLAHPGRENEVFENVAALDTAKSTDIACLHNPQFYLEQLPLTQAGAVIVSEKFVERVPAGVIAIVAEQPYKAFAIIASLFYPANDAKGVNSKINIHPSASVHPSVTLGEGVEVSAGAVVNEHAVIGAHSWIGPHAVIDRGVVLGENVRIGAHVSVSFALVGNRVRIDAGARIGQSGFGFFMDHRNGHVPVPQLGRVCIGHDVMIGSNTTIDRGSMQDTVIEDGCMIDNLVQIAHNVHLGKRCVVVAQVGLSGSTHVGNAVTLAGQAGITGHLHIGDGAVVMAQSGVMRDVPAGTTVAGSPAVPAYQWRRQVVIMNQQTKKV